MGAAAEASRGAALIVGAGPRLGAAIARRLGKDGLRVGLLARSPDAVEALATSLRTEGFSAVGAAADVADADQVTGAVDGLARRVGPFEVAVHNVSVWRDAGAGTLTAGDLLADLAVGATSLATIVNAVLPAMTARGGGTILSTGSGAADHATPGAPSLAVQKAALRILTLGFAAELAPRGVHCASVTVTGGLDTHGFAVADIADVYADLVAETSGPRELWRTVVEFAGNR